ncbi:unnamed protein product [Ectocarpus sp. 12 AP-2014]
MLIFDFLINFIAFVWVVLFADFENLNRCEKTSAFESIFLWNIFEIDEIICHQRDLRDPLDWVRQQIRARQTLPLFNSPKQFFCFLEKHAFREISDFGDSTCERKVRGRILIQRPQ